MKKISVAAVDPALVHALQSLNPQQQVARWENSGNAASYASRFKADITQLLLVEQNRRCAYCGDRLHGDKPSRDHVAPKGLALHPEWCFEPANLVLACAFCNTERKGSTDTVSVKDAEYEKTQFTIVHPCQDDPTLHLVFVGHRLSVLIQAKPGSAKGAETIRMFDLASTLRSKQRVKDALLDPEVAYLNGRYRLLAEQLTLSLLSKNLALRIRK